MTQTFDKEGNETTALEPGECEGCGGTGDTGSDEYVQCGRCGGTGKDPFASEAGRGD